MLHRITFRTNLDSIVTDEKCEDTRYEYENVADSYIGSLDKYGHIFDGYSFGWCNGVLSYYVEASRPDSIEPSQYGEFTNLAYRDAKKKFGTTPTIELLSDQAKEPLPRWEDSSSLYLLATAFGVMGPVKCGDSGDEIPLYLLPVSDRTREKLYFWRNEYQACDRLWLASGALEIPTYKQMADPTSKLSASGRELCQTIEAATGKPTYFYVMRYNGRNSGEETRPCPVCGNAWHTRDRDVLSEPFHSFHFRCKPCRLVSSVANNVEPNEEHAEIGEPA